MRKISDIASDHREGNVTFKSLSLTLLGSLSEDPSPLYAN